MQKQVDMKSDDHLQEELDWRAFCYVTGELDQAELAQFEALLGTDQGAREAVASALETLQLVTAVESLEPAASLPDKALRYGHVAWMSLGAALALSLAIVVPRLITGDSSDDRLRAANLTPELAVAWSKSHSELPLLSDLSLPVDSTESNDGDEAYSRPSSQVAPAWMVAAVRGVAQHEMSESAPEGPAGTAPPIEMEN